MRQIQKKAIQTMIESDDSQEAQIETELRAEDQLPEVSPRQDFSNFKIEPHRFGWEVDQYVLKL
jgi:hypothetical protein